MDPTDRQLSVRGRKAWSAGGWWCEDGLISAVSPGSLVGYARGQWILTSFTHGCKHRGVHNAGLPVLLGNQSRPADRSLPGWKMDELAG